MATHTTGPADPDNPRKNRHTLAERGSSHGAESYRLLLERDCAALLEWLGETPFRDLSPDCLREYAAAHKWTPGYLRGIVERTKAYLQEAARETAEQARARIVAMADEIRHDAHAMADFGPAVSALKLQADLLVPKVEQHQHVHAHFVAEIPAIAKTAEEWEKQG